MKLRFATLLFALICITLAPLHQAAARGRAKAEPPVSVEPKLSVLSPLGNPPPIKVMGMAPRSSALDGKTIYIVDDGFVGGDVLLKEMAAWFNKNMPNVNVLYRRKAGAFEQEDPALWAEIKAKGDAVIMGMGH